DRATDYWSRNWTVPPGRKPANLGICVSGGGVRSASVTLGALQELGPDVLTKAEYLVSVSGGGYMIGAMQLALTGAGDPPAGDAVAIAVAAALAVVAYLIQLSTFSLSSRHPSLLRDAARVLTATALLLVVLGLVVPSIVWASAWLSWHIVPSSKRAATASTV